MRPPNPSPLPDRRIEDRLAVRIPAFARELGRRPIAVTVTDLSEHGCHLHDCDMKEGASVWVEFASLAPRGARVIWGTVWLPDAVLTSRWDLYAWYWQA
jgi:hypothetical protein